jgi:hypothetical protein
VDKSTISSTTSIISVVMLCIGLATVFIPPMVFEAVSSYYRDSEIVEEVIDSTLMASTVPTLSLTLLILGLVGIGGTSLLKK